VSSILQRIIFEENEYQSLSEAEKKENCHSWKINSKKVVQLSKLRKNPTYILVSLRDQRFES
jgi:hypothetical protein